ncbi:MAG: methionyl-tRNA formyltransferase, partial [Myxococcota bacterium]|nr:methionyl-tRNA formyltransferase [Myxococcota bacterium]
MRVAFMGTPDLAATSLRSLLGSRHEVVAVVSQPDRPSGRGRTVSPTPVAAVARAAEVPLLQPPSVGTAEFRAWLAQYTPDIAVVAAFGRILGPKLLALPRLGSINVHASLLPRWRGASPIQAAIIAGDSATGVTIMQMVRELDAGDILHAVETPIAETDTAATLHDRLADLGGAALLDTLDQIEAGGAVAVPQDQ